MNGVANGLRTNILFHVSLEKMFGWRSKKFLVRKIIVKSFSERPETFRISCNIFRFWIPSLEASAQMPRGGNVPTKNRNCLLTSALLIALLTLKCGY